MMLFPGKTLAKREFTDRVGNPIPPQLSKEETESTDIMDGMAPGGTWIRNRRWMLHPLLHPLTLDERSQENGMGYALLSIVSCRLAGKSAIGTIWGWKCRKHWGFACPKSSNHHRTPSSMGEFEGMRPWNQDVWSHRGSWVP